MSYIGQGLPADVFAGFTIDKFTGDGTANKALTLSKAPFSETTVLVTIDGVVQEPTDDFTVSGTTLTLVGTAANGSEINVTHLSGTVPSTLASKVDVNGVSDTLILDADGDTTISADTDDQIDFKAGGTDTLFVTNGKVGITNAPDLGAGLHIKTSDSGATNLADADELVIESSGSAGINIFTGTSSVGQINFGDSGANERGKVKYNHSNDKMTFTAGSVETLTIEPGGQTNTTSAEGNNTAFEVKHTGDGSSSYPYGQAIRFPNANRDNNTEYFILCIDSVGSKFRVDSDGDVKNHDNSYGSTSDSRIKQGIRDANSQWDDIKALKVRNYKKNDDVEQYGDKAWEQIGVIAQELESSGMDKLVKDEVLDEDGNITEYKSVKYSILYMKAIKALQEAMAKIETLETKVKALEDA